MKKTVKVNRDEGIFSFTHVLVYMNNFLDVSGCRHLSIILLLLSHSHYHVLPILLYFTFLFLMSLCLFMQKFHHGDPVGNTLWIIDEQELLLTIVQYLVCSALWIMQDEEVRWPPFPGCWIVRILRHVYLWYLFTLFKFFLSSFGSCLSILFIWVKLLYHWRTFIPLVDGIGRLLILGFICNTLSNLY
jgi:hypothetical protein